MEYWLISSLAAFAPIIAIIGAFITPLLFTVTKSKKLVFTLSELVLTTNAIIAVLVAYYVYTNNAVLYYIFAGFPPPLGEAYEIDAIGAYMGLLIGLVFPFVNIFSYRYLEEHGGYEWYYTLYLGLEAGLLGIAYTGDMFNLFVMLEVASIASYALTAFKRKLGYPLDAAIKYAIVGSVASTMYFIAVVLAYSGFGTLSMADLAAQLMGSPTGFDITYGYTSSIVGAATLFLGLAVWAFLIESALVPHHFWLPDAYSAAPATVAATLAAVAEGVGVYVVLRYMYTIVGLNYSLWLQWILLVLGSLGVIVGGLLMVLQNELKRIIAYSTIMDVGFMFIGVGIGTPLAIEATLFYVMSHAIVKPLLFLVAGAIEHTYGTTRLDTLTGQLRATPVLAAGLIIGGLAVAGVPPTNLFVAKLSLIMSVLDTGYYPLLAIIALGSALGLVGFLRALYSTYFEIKEPVPRKQTPLSFSTLIIVLVVLVIATGLLYNYISDNLLQPAIHSLIDPASRTQYVKVAEEYLKLLSG